MEPVFRALEITAKILVKVQGLKLTFLDLDKLPAAGGVVLAINHTAYVDFLPQHWASTTGVAACVS